MEQRIKYSPARLSQKTARLCRGKFRSVECRQGHHRGVQLAEQHRDQDEADPDGDERAEVAPAGLRSVLRQIDQLLTLAPGERMRDLEGLGEDRGVDVGGL